MIQYILIRSKLRAHKQVERDDHQRNFFEQVRIRKPGTITAPQQLQNSTHQSLDLLCLDELPIENQLATRIYSDRPEALSIGEGISTKQDTFIPNMSKYDRKSVL